MSQDNRIPVPDHVPAHLVIDFDYRTIPPGDDPVSIFEALGDANVPPVFYAPQHGGYWVVLGHEAVREVLRDNDHFTTYPTGIPAVPARPRKFIPLESDPPEHTRYRTAVASLFSPKAVKKLEDRVRQFSIELIEDIAPKGRCDYVHDFARRMPTSMFLTIMGMPLERLDDFLEWEHGLFRGVIEERMEAGKNIGEYFQGFIEEKTRNPGDDAATHLLNYKDANGQHFTHEEVFDTFFLFFLAGMDTVPNTFSFTWRYLAENPDARRYIIEQPEKVADVADEMLRITAVVNTNRRVKQDTELMGVAMKEGDAVLLPLAYANRDARVFEDPTTVRFDREVNQHLTFGAGAHRCLGSHLAKTELRIALVEWLKRIPDFEIEDYSRVRAMGGGSVGLEALPLVWEPKA